MTKKRLSFDIGADYIKTEEGFEDKLFDDGADTKPDLQDTAYAKALRTLLEDNLTKKQKCYIILYYRDKLTVKEIADRFGVDKSTVSRTINRGRQRMTGTLGKETLRMLFEGRGDGKRYK